MVRPLFQKIFNKKKVLKIAKFFLSLKNAASFGSFVRQFQFSILIHLLTIVTTLKVSKMVESSFISGMVRPLVLDGSTMM